MQKSSSLLLIRDRSLKKEAKSLRHRNFYPNQLAGLLLKLICVASIALIIEMIPARYSQNHFAIRSAMAQSEISLASLQVQLWPEYDQPTMLVIYDFELPAETELPARVTFRIPEEANLIAVASQQNTGLVNAQYEGPVVENGWQVFTVVVNNLTSYHFEYYEQLDKTAGLRRFSYLWDGSYAVSGFNISVLQPVDTTSLTAEPRLESVTSSDGTTIYKNQPISLQKGEQFVLRISYEKDTETLAVPAQDLQPASPVDEKTLGRISVENYLPFIIGAIGLVLVLGGLVYYWRAGGTKTTNRPRSRSAAQEARRESATSIYCPQCGTRAKMNDHFCRICGSRLRKKEE